MVKRTSHRTIKIRVVVSIIGATVLVYLLCARIFHIWPATENLPTTSPSAAQTTSKLPSAQSNFTGGGKKSDNKTPGAAASATDTNGLLPQTTPSSATWSKSQDGSSIIVMGPSKDSPFSTDDTVYGTATSGMVSYELEDDVSGVILQGQAKVVSGKFSVKLSFSTSGTNGRINVFNQAPDGTESNNVSIPVRFK